MNSLPLSHHLFYLTRFLLGKPLLTNPALHCSAKLVPRPSHAQQKNFFSVCIKFDKGGNSMLKQFEGTANIRSNL